MQALRALANVSFASIARWLGLRYWWTRLRRPSRLAAADRERLRLLRSDNLAAAEPFRATALWRGAARLFEREFHLSGVEDVEGQYYNLRFFGYAPGDHRLYDYLVYTYYQVVKQRDVLDLIHRAPATAPLGPGRGYEFDGARVSLDQLLSIDDFYNMRELRPELDQAALVVADLGAGWGRLGYVLRRANPRISYVVFDLPETLLVSSSYLPRLLPDASVAGFDVARALGGLDRATLRGRDLWFLGSQALPRLADGTIDLFVNVASFQEMTRRQVELYFGLIDRTARGGSLYLRQLWSGSTHGHRLGEVAGFDDYPFLVSWRRAFLRNSRFSHLFFEAGFQL